MDNTKYYVVKKKAVPEVLIKVVETKRLLATRRGMTIQEATEEIGISRSSFYKPKRINESACCSLRWILL